MSKRLNMDLAGLFLSIGMALAQTTVSGTVVSSDDGEPVIGASVMVKGTQTGSVTDIDGHFSFSSPQDNPQLVISYVGMKTVTVKGGQNVKVTLQPDDDGLTLNEVVVTGMQKMDKRLFTGATTKVNAEDTKLDGVADVSRALEGRAAGVSVQNVSGTFGTAPKIRVRGATSIYGSSKPLWVIDGVIQEDAVDVSADDLSSGDAVTLISNAISGLSADDIESFQILKDGSATSIYGARAMAGVVVITTKRGRAGRSTINYTGEFTYRLKPSYRQYNISDSQEQMGIYKEMAAKGWLEFATVTNASTSGIYGKMYKLIDEYDPTTGQFGLAHTEAAMNRYLQEAEFRNTDWFDLLFKSNVVQNHSVSISTGTEKASLYGSVSAMVDPGWTLDSKVKRFTANMNAMFNLSKQLQLSILTNGSFRDQQAPGTLSRSTDPVSGSINRDFDINPFSYAMNTSRALDPNTTYTRNYAPFNIFDELANNYIDLTVSDMKFQGELTWKPVLGLEIHGMGAYRIVNTTQEHSIKNHSNQAEAYRAGVDDPNIMNSNTFLYNDPDKPNSLPMSVMPTGGIFSRTDNKMEQLQFRGTVQYNKVWNDTHIMNLFGGMEANKVDRSSTAHDTYGVDFDNNRNVDLPTEFYKQAKEEGTKLDDFSKTWTRNLAYFLSGSYSYKGRYTLNLTGRYEGTNGLGKARSSRWLPTWNVSGAWNAHEESWFQKWMEDINYGVSHATMRLSYSLTADRVPSFVSNALPVIYSQIAWRPNGDQQEPMLYLYQIANSELTYEKKREFNIGFDFGFLRNRLNLTVDAYWRSNFDLIGTIKTQGADGFITKYANVATMKSSGIETTISSTNIQTNDFKWNTDFTFSYATNEITKLDSRSNVINLVSGVSDDHFRVGYPRSAIFSIPFAGLNEEGLPTFINEKGERVVSDIYFQEYENVDYLKYEGPTEPTVTGGLNNTFTWKNWRLNIFVTYSFGNKVRLDPIFSNRYSDMSAMPKEFKNRWVVPGDEERTSVPTIASRRQVYNDPQLSYAYNAYNYSTERIANGGFIRMKDISLTYDFKPSLINRIGLSTASVKLDATNLFLIYSDKKLNGQDPEFINSGGVATPMAKQFTMTLRLGI